MTVMEGTASSALQRGVWIMMCWNVVSLQKKGRSSLLLQEKQEPSLKEIY